MHIIRAILFLVWFAGVLSGLMLATLLILFVF